MPSVQVCQADRADNLTAKFIDAVETKVAAWVHTSACNIVAASSPCFAQSLQLAVNGGFNLFVHEVIVAALAVKFFLHCVKKMSLHTTMHMHVIFQAPHL